MESSVNHETLMSLPYPPPKGEAPLVKKKLDDCNKTNPECCLPDKT